MGIEDVMADPRFGDGRVIPTEEARSELYGIVAGVLKTRPCREWEKLFEDADVPYARVGTATEAMENPQVRANDMVVELHDPKLGPVSQMGLPIKLSATPGEIRGPRPAPGQHTEGVLSEVAAPGAEPPQVADRPTTPLPQPLHGVRVLETANVIAGPTAGKLLADLGAEVIKLEPPSGDISRSGTPPYFYVLNANKRSVAVNARSEIGKGVAARLASTVDILAANMRPGATGRIGIGSDVLAKVNPGIIEAHVTAFGWAGPYSHRAGLDRPLGQVAPRRSSWPSAGPGRAGEPACVPMRPTGGADGLRCGRAGRAGRALEERTAQSCRSSSGSARELRSESMSIS